MSKKPPKSEAKRGNGQPLVVSYLRFSTPEQAMGDSIRRQIDRAAEWAAGKGWTIDDTLRDEGVSAFRGRNADTGALGRIVASIDRGDIPAGSFLVIENFDRLSRGELLEAIELLLGIVRKGVTLVTLSDGREYGKGTFNLTELIISATTLSRANEESKRKSELVGAAWRRKKGKDAREGKAITARLPAWLRLDGGKIVPVKEHVATVREIFALAVKGYGRNAICKRLNQKFGGKGLGSKPWSNTYVLNVLRSRAVLGEYQPHRLTYVEGKKQRVPEGEPIPSYYPAVVDERTYYAAQQGLEQRRRTGGPVNGVTVNLWQGLLHDVEGHRIISKSQPGWRRYYISAGRDGRGKGAKYIAFPANQFDFALLHRLIDLMPKPATADHAAQVKEIDGRLSEIAGKLTELSAAIESRPLQTLIAAIERLEAEQAALERERYALQKQQATASGAVPIGSIIGDLQRVLLGTLTHEDRMRLREAIRAQVERIDARLSKAADDDPEASQRDYVASMRVLLKSGEEVFVAFRLWYIDYRAEGHNKENPYRIEWLVDA